jgi:hypothetical protein
VKRRRKDDVDEGVQVVPSPARQVKTENGTTLPMKDVVSDQVEEAQVVVKEEEEALVLPYLQLVVEIVLGVLLLIEDTRKNSRHQNQALKEEEEVAFVMFLKLKWNQEWMLYLVSLQAAVSTIRNDCLIRFQ